MSRKKLLKTLTVKVTPHMHQAIQTLIDRRLYPNKAEIIREAVRRLVTDDLKLGLGRPNDARMENGEDTQGPG